MQVRKYTMKQHPRSPKNYTGPRLITVYRLTYPGAEQVQQYYKYDFYSDDESVYVEACPGCGKNLKYKAVDHKCDGSLTDQPLNTAFKQIRPNRVLREQQLRHYLSNKTHNVIVSEGSPKDLA